MTKTIRENTKINIVEVFNSIDGEVNGFCQGRVTTFIRFAGCNLNCPWCDTKESISEDSGRELSLDSLLKHSLIQSARNITITGGEPLMQVAELCLLIDELLKENPARKINVETNGSLYFSMLDRFLHHSSVKWTVDYKFLNTQAFPIHHSDVLKIVISDENQLTELARTVMSQRLVKEGVILAISVVMMNGTYIVPIEKAISFMRYAENFGYSFALNCQLHKFIGAK